MKRSSALLDTNIVIALFAGDPKVAVSLARYSAVYVPVQVLGELYYGALHSSRVEENLKKIADFSDKVALLNAGGETAEEYGAVKQELSKRGRLIPENDIWIAASARAHKATLLTRDAHFRQVKGLQAEFL